MTTTHDVSVAGNKLDKSGGLAVIALMKGKITGKPIRQAVALVADLANVPDDAPVIIDGETFAWRDVAQNCREIAPFLADEQKRESASKTLRTLQKVGTESGLTRFVRNYVPPVTPAAKK